MAKIQKMQMKPGRLQAEHIGSPRTAEALQFRETWEGPQQPLKAATPSRYTGGCGHLDPGASEALPPSLEHASNSLITGKYEGSSEQPVQLLSFLEDAYIRTGSVGAGRPGAVRYMHLQDQGQQHWQNDWASNRSRAREKPRRWYPPRVQNLQLLESSRCQHPLLGIEFALRPRLISPTTLPLLSSLSNPFLLIPFPN